MTMQQIGGFKAGGVFKVWKKLPSGIMVFQENAHNLLPASAINYLLNSGTGAGGVSQITSWYIGLMKNYTPVDGTTMAALGLVANEFTSYTEGARQAWTLDGASTSKLVSNSNAPASFTGSANGLTIYGAFICSSQTWNETSSQVLCAAQFASAKALDSGEKLVITYELAGASGD